jgi:hypothetical protein
VTAFKRAPRRLHSRAAVAAGLVAFFVLAGTGVATAAWQASTSVNSSVTAATVKMTLTAASGSLGTLYSFTGTPPTPTATVVTVVKGVALTNTGTAPLNYSLFTSIAAGNTLPTTAVRVFLWTTTGTCSTTIGAGSTSGSLAGPLNMPLAAASAVPGAAFTLCIGTNLTTTVAVSQGLTITPTFTVTGKVGTSPWTTSTADAVFTQSVYQMSNPGSLTCTAASNSKSVTLSWTAPFATGSTGNVTYQIIEASGAVLVPFQSGLVSGQISWDSSGPSRTLLLQAKEDLYGSTSTGISITLSQGTQGNSDKISCP